MPTDPMDDIEALFDELDAEQDEFWEYSNAEGFDFAWYIHGADDGDGGFEFWQWSDMPLLQRIELAEGLLADLRHEQRGGELDA